jgi:hypothetical protein
MPPRGAVSLVQAGGAVQVANPIVVMVPGPGQPGADYPQPHSVYPQPGPAYPQSQPHPQYPVRTPASAAVPRGWGCSLSVASFLSSPSLRL